MTYLRLLFKTATLLPLCLNAGLIKLYQTSMDPIPGGSVSLSQFFDPKPTIIGDAVVFGGIEGGKPLILGYQNSELSLVYDGRTGYPDSTPLLAYVHGVANNADALYFGVARNESPRDGVILKIQDGSLSQASVPPALQALGNGSGNYYYRLAAVSADGNIMALLGLDNGFLHFVLRSEGSNVEILARESVTIAPGTSATFQDFNEVSMSPDTSRISFGGATAGGYGIYLWNNGTLTRIIDQTVNYPGTSTPFGAIRNRASGSFDSAGNFYFIGGTVNTATLPEDRVGLLRYTATGQLEVIADNTTLVEGITMEFLSDIRISASDTVVFRDGSGDLFTFDGTTLQRLPVTQVERSWVLGDWVYFIKTYPMLGSPPLVQLQRIPVSGGSIEAYNLRTTDGTNIDAPYNIDVKGDTLVVSTLSQVLMDSHAIFSSDNLLPLFSTFFYTPGDDAPYFNTVYYGSFYSTNDAWPWVYSFEAAHWLYLTGWTPFPLTAWNPDLGWIQSKHNTWPWYYVFGDTWYYWQ